MTPAPQDEARRIRRLEDKLAGCTAAGRRLSWARLAVFLAGVIGAPLSADRLGAAAGWAVFGAAALVFSGLVVWHRRLDGWSEALHIWQRLYRQQAARRQLDWENIPAPAAADEPPTPLALDLDLTGPHSLHHLLDSAVSHQGSRRLAAWLTNDTPDPPEITRRQAVVRELARLRRFRQRLALIFHQVSRTPLDGEQLLAWLQTPYPEAALRQVLPWATLLAFINAALLLASLAGLLPPFWLLSALVYGWLYLRYQPILAPFLAAVLRLDGELSKFRPLLLYLQYYRYPTGGPLQAQCAPFWAAPDRPNASLGRLQAVTALAGLRSNQLLGPLLNLLTPWDFWAAWLAAGQRQRLSRLLPRWLDAFHELEALLSLANFADLNPTYAFPTLASGGLAFAAEKLGHPLLPAARKVCNDLRLDALGEILLITGSNMAGKSTFIRTVGINLCLAYAGGPVDAVALQTLPFRLYTCIRINDSLGDGFSYFYAEVKRLKGLLQALQTLPSGRPLLYLIDEIFRGTNNRERLLGSRAYIQSLIGAAGVGLIATHDLELAALADEHPQARNFHFSDSVSAGKLSFDYRLRPGVCPTTNALKIMALEGLPVPKEIEE